MRERLEARFEQEREALQRAVRASVEAELQTRFEEDRTGLVREQQRLEDELRRLNDQRQSEAQEGEAARSQAEEFQRRLLDEQRVHERRSQEALDAAQQRWKAEQERLVEEIRIKLTTEYERKLEEAQQSALDQRNRLPRLGRQPIVCDRWQPAERHRRRHSRAPCRRARQRRCGLCAGALRSERPASTARRQRQQEQNQQKPGHSDAVQPPPGNR